MNELIAVLIPIISLLLGAIGTMIGILTYSNSRQKEAKQRHSDQLQREFEAGRSQQHLTRNYEQMNQNLTALFAECDRRFDEQALELKEVKGLLNIIIMKVSSDTTSAVHRYQLRGDQQ